MKISIIIPCYNNLEYTRKCIESLVKYTDFSDTRLIIVSNGCTDGTDEYIKVLPLDAVLLSYPDALGYPKAVNEGLHYALDTEGSEFVILLNNDTELLPQPVDDWKKILLSAFDDPKVGVAGPIKGHCTPSGRDFVIFFCAMIRTATIRQVGFLDEIFSPGGGEDCAFCVEAEDRGWRTVQVPDEILTPIQGSNKLLAGTFPIYHEGEATVEKLDNWNEIFNRNSQILRERYNQKWKLTNNFERAVIGAKDHIPVRENARYRWAAKFVKPGESVLDIGCSSGYALRYLPKDVKYTGIDKDEAILKYAKSEFPQGNFYQLDLEKQEITGFYDHIIAFEVIEHLENGLQLAQELKKKCKHLILTTPYDESPGWWGQWHKLHHLKPENFPDFSYRWIVNDGFVTGAKPEADKGALLLMEWPKRPKILAEISTKGRHDTTLPMAIASLANQTIPPDFVLISDDGDQGELYKFPQYTPLFTMLRHKGIDSYILYGQKKGQHHNHEIAQVFALQNGFDYIMRADDDVILEPNVIEVLLSKMSDDVGAVGGPILVPEQHPMRDSSYATTIDSINSFPHPQWTDGQAEQVVEHLHCSFLFRPGIAHYELGLSPVAHREETLFSYAISRAGYKLIYTPHAITWHLKQPTGGIRSYPHPELYAHDENIFKQKLAEYGKAIKVPFEVYLNNGIGDHLCFARVLPDLLKQHNFIRIACCYLDVFRQYTPEFIEQLGFKGKQIEFTSLAISPVVPEQYDIYKWMWDRGWKSSLTDAFRCMYTTPLKKEESFVRNEAKNNNIIIAPFAKKLRNDKENAKNFPYWKEVIAALSEKYHIIQLGINGEPQLCEDFRCDLHISEIETLLRECYCFISVDSFLQHLAHDVGTRGVVIFSKSDPNIFGYSENINLLKDTKYLRPLQFDIWETVEFDKDAFVGADEVIKAVERVRD